MLDSSSTQTATRSGVAPFTIDYASTAGGEPQLDAKTLGIIRFGNAPSGRGDARELRVPLMPLDDRSTVEIWRSTEQVEHGWIGELGYARNSEVMLVQLSVDESRFPNFELATFDAYTRIQDFLASQDYPHPIRIWNYFPEINTGNGDAERYKQFSVGRARVIESLPEYEERLPAASAIGSTESQFFIYLLAARQGGVQIENPRQVSAFHYPRQYGVRSPSFSRARLVRWPRERHLYLSGTASVVGHETLHVDDCTAQLQETIRNIESLLSNTAIARPSLPGLGWADLKLLRVYLRHANTLPTVRAALEAQLGSETPVLYLLGDICRQDLALEIEGIFTSQT